MSSEEIKHIEFIQGIITRMNSNSFQIKAWTITIVSAILAVFTSTKNADFLLIAMFPVIIFWFLDTFYLLQERKFRGLFDDVTGNTNVSNKIKQFDMSVQMYTKKINKKYSF